MKQLADGSGAKWREYLGLAAMFYYLMLQSETGFSPLKMMYGREVIAITEVSRSSYFLIPVYGHEVQEHAKEMESLFERARYRAVTVREVRASVQNAIMNTREHPLIRQEIWWGMNRYGGKDTGNEGRDVGYGPLGSRPSPQVPTTCWEKLIRPPWKS